jgi:protein O-mannosyl-transferase
MNASCFFKGESRLPLPGLLSLILAGMVLVLYSGTLGADFIWGDDQMNIYGNPHIQSLNGGSLAWMFTDYQYVRRYMPLGWLGWALNIQATGLNPGGFHLGNLLFHAANTVLVFLFLFKVLRRGRLGGERPPAQVWICAALAAALWAIHPLRVEPVAWASGRIYCQATFFLLVSWLAYLKWDECDPSVQDQRGRRWYYVLAVVAYAVSLLTYPVALGAVVVFFLLDFYPRRHGEETAPPGFFPGRQSAARLWLSKVPFCGAAAAVMGLTLWARVDTSQYLPPPSWQEFPLLDRVMQAFYMWAYYLWKPWWPTDLSPYYSNLIDFDPASWRFAGSLILVLGLSGVLFWKWRRWPGVLFVWIAYLVILVPLLGLTERPHSPNDRYNYIVDFGYGVLLAGGLLRAWTRPRVRAALVGLVVLFLSGFGFLNWKQSERWRDTVTLYRYMVKQLGDSPFRADVMMGLGVFYQERHEPERAAAIFEGVLRIKPDEPSAHSNLADILVDAGRTREAEDHYREALRVQPNHRNARQNLGIILAQQGRLEEAAVQFSELLRYYPDNSKAHRNLSLTLAKLGRREEAQRHLQKAIQLEVGENPDLIQAAHSK